MMTRTVLGELLHRLPISYGGEVGALGAAKIVELFERELEALIIEEQKQIKQAYKDGHKHGKFCDADAYYEIKFEGRK